MRKRVCSLALCLTLALSLVTVPAWAEEEEDLANGPAETAPVEEVQEETPVEEVQEETPVEDAEEAPMLLVGEAAEEGTAWIGEATSTENGYYTFDEALDLENIEKLVLKENIDVTTSTISIDKEITLDLNGYEIKAGNTEASRIFVAEGGKLTLKDSTAGADGVGDGRIYTETDYEGVPSGFPVVSVYGSFVMESGYIEAIRPDVAQKGQFAVGGSGKVVINNGKIKAGWYALSCNGKEEGADFTVNGGVLESTADYAIYFSQSTELTINGGEITGATGAVAMNDGKLLVTGGTLVSKGAGVTGEWSDGTGKMGNAVLNFNGKYGDIAAVIEGGTFTAEGDAFVFIKTTSNATTVSIKGGEFNALDCLDYLVSGADITVKLAKDTVQDVVIPEEATVTLDLNGKTLTNKAGKHTIDNNGTLTLTGGGTVDNVSHGKGALNNSGVVTIGNVNLTRSAEAGKSPKDSGGNSWYVVYNTGTILDIQGGAEITATGRYSSLICNCGTPTKPAKIDKITGGTFANNFVVLKNDEFGQVGKITGGTFTAGAEATETATVLNYGTIGDISGGVFINQGEPCVLRCSNWKGDPEITGHATITGGTFTAAVGGAALRVDKGENPGTGIPTLTVKGGKFSGDLRTDEVGKLLISGGSFSKAVPEAYLADGYAAVDSDVDGYPYAIGKTYTATFTVTPKDATVVVKNAKGDTVDANEGGTFTLNTANTYTYTVSASGYKDKTDTITAPTGDDDSVTVTVELDKKSSGGGGGGGSSSSGSTSDTVTNKDGSTTTTVTDKKTGTVTETTKEKDGTVTTVETKKDGTVTETVKNPDGVTGTVVTNDDGEVTKASASVSSAAAKEAAKNGEAVTLPVEIPAADSTKEAPVLTVSVPKSAEGVKVEIPVENVTSGTVAVIVHADGTEEIVKTSVVTEDGVALVLEADATIKIVDNSKDFVDVPNTYWAADAVNYVASRELFNGTGADTFTPAAPMTRAMLMTVLARLDGADTSGDAYAKGMAWAVEKGVSDGTDPDGTISRQQLAVMLWRYAGSPAAENTALDFTDAGAVADYAAQAMQWAVDSGILSGTADGALNPEGQATRAHVAAMLMRFNNAML